MDMRRFARRPFIGEEEIAEAAFAKDDLARNRSRANRSDTANTIWRFRLGSVLAVISFWSWT
jgi:hypothetical protein